MRFGYCTSPENADVAARAGFDYVECNASALAALSPEAFEVAKQQLEKAGIPCESTNVLLPGSIKIVGSEADPDTYRAYLTGVMERLRVLGVQTAVFGSGGARRVPETVTFEKAREQLEAFARILAEIAKAHGIQIAAEPLNYRECNLLVTQDETAALVRQVDAPSFGLLLDTFHYAFEVRPYADLTNWSDLFVHFHIARPWARTIPLPEDGYDYRPFFDALHAIGYDGRVSIEASGCEESALCRSCAYLRELSARASF